MDALGQMLVRKILLWLVARTNACAQPRAGDRPTALPTAAAVSVYKGCRSSDTIRVACECICIYTRMAAITHEPRYHRPAPVMAWE